MATRRPNSAASDEAPRANLPINIQEELSQQAKAISQRLTAPSAPIIRVKQNKEFEFPNGDVGSEPFPAVILDFVAKNLYYPGRYNPNAITPPACFAIGYEPSKLIASDNSPEKQNDTCAGCEKNEFGSGEGAGKACKNSRVLALLPPDAKQREEDGEDVPIWLITVSPTALKAYDSYVRQLASARGVMPIQVITHIGFDPNSDYPTLRFGRPEAHVDIEYYYGRVEEARGILTAEPDVSNFGAAPAAPAAGGRRGATPSRARRG